MKRPFIGTAAIAVLVVVAAGAPAVSAQTQQPAALSAASLHLLSGDDPLCSSGSSLCADPYDNSNGQYVGHDEPSLIYKSGIPGSGNDMTYTVTLPKDPKQQPNARTCTWQEGGPFIPGTKNDFGGVPPASMVPLLQTVFPVAGPTTITRFDNFNSGDMRNPCPVKGAG